MLMRHVDWAVMSCHPTFCLQLVACSSRPMSHALPGHLRFIVSAVAARRRLGALRQCGLRCETICVCCIEQGVSNADFDRQGLVALDGPQQQSIMHALGRDVQTCAALAAHNWLGSDGLMPEYVLS